MASKGAGEAKLADGETSSKMCDQLDGDIAELRARYEQYFLGIDRMPPAQLHAEVKKRLMLLKDSHLRNTGLKFRAQSLHARFLTYERLWTRTIQEMENGTYHRDLFKARLHANRRGAVKPKDAPAAAQPSGAKGPATNQAPSASTQAPSPGGLTQARIKAVYDAYVMAKKQCQEDVSKVSMDSVAAALRKQVPDLLKKHNAREIDFKVVIKDGKATLRAVPK